MPTSVDAAAAFVTAGKRIALIMHEFDRDRPERYAITHLAKYWEQDGHTVEFVFGLENHAPADIAILHVNLSVVPDEYVEFSDRYPIVLNKRALDIRKSSFSTNLLRAGDDYEGPVIVKSDLNYAGVPERVRIGATPAPTAITFDSPSDYLVLDALGDVAPEVFADSGLVIEKFLPEVENGRYHTRIYQFLGDRHTCTRLAGDHPVVNSSSTLSTEAVDPAPEVVDLRDRLGFDYGKFDYVVHGGQPIVLDINKTTGAAGSSARIERNRQRRAQGLYAYFD